MKRFKNILLVVEKGTATEASLTRAARLAAMNHAHLTVMDVVEEIPATTRALLKLVSPEELQEALVAQRRQELEEQTAPLTDEGLAIEVVIAMGTPFVEIIRSVCHRKHDLVMKAARGAGGAAERLFGSTDLHLLRKCPCPVWMLKAATFQPYRRVLAAVNPPEPGDADDGGLSRLILDLATSLARMEASELHLVHTWSLYGESLLRGRMQALEVQRLEEAEREAHRHRLAHLLADYEESGPPLQVHLLKGEPATLVPELAHSEGADLIVMGTVGRTGLPGLLIGNTAESVLSQVDSAVLTVKPAGFVSPVTL